MASVSKIYIGDSNGEAKEIYPAEPNVYGAVWDGSADTFWTRTDKAANFADPNPYYADMTDTPSSPFDSISPWKDMIKSEDANAGTVVSIPKYYYKWTKTGDAMKLQIAPASNGAVWASENGFLCSPAHADRGDGKGERDIVYVGRYHCSVGWKSTTGNTLIVSRKREDFRTYIHNLGSTIWQWDYAMYWTIAMLYLVEFADWNSQKVIGHGCSPNSRIANCGGTDAMQYHTGTSAANRTTYGWTQYRWIEGLWDNVLDWCDGIYFSSANVYCIKNPANFSDTSGGTRIGNRPTSSNSISAWNVPTASGFEYALYPSALGGSYSTYVGDKCINNSSGVVLYIGGGYDQSKAYGLFCLGSDNSASTSSSSIGSRLMILP